LYNDEQAVAGFVYANVISVSVIGIGWLIRDVSWQQTDDPVRRRQWTLPVQNVLAVICTGFMMLIAIGGAAVSVIAGLGFNEKALVIASPWGLAALLGLGLLLASLLWETRPGWHLVAAYIWGYIAIALAANGLHQLPLFGSGRHAASWTVVGAGIAAAGYVALTGHLWKWGANIAQAATRLRIPHPVAKLEHISRWLPALNLVATLVICALGFLTIFTAQSRDMRVAVAFAPLLLAYGISCLAQQHRRRAMQGLSLLLVVVCAIFVGWADVRIPGEDPGLLAYSARLLVVLAGMSLLYSTVVTRWLGAEHEWYDAVRRVGVKLAIATGGILVLVLGLEVSYFTPGIGAPIGEAEVIAISVMLFGLLVALLSMAVLPGRDPLALTEKGRQGYVYAAQVLAALLLAHIYLAKPELFQFGIMDYWPYIVMLISFASVAFAEFCFRRGWRVIAEPMERTGGFLPLLPALTAWAFCDPAEISYPLTLFFAGLIYVFMSVSRRSFLAGVAAAIMGNGALWALLKDEGLLLTSQPQLWMIPPALSVLGASYINRERLSDNTLTAIRYICVMIIYLSSTGEMFMKLLGDDIDAPQRWLRPLILTGLSVSGIFAGILLRVRAFLYLGSSFLLMSIIGMVWNAHRAIGHVWPWWAFGISLGLFILVVFGVFEKNRQEVQQLITRLRQWEP
jgi:hypothetical protein